MSVQPNFGKAESSLKYGNTILFVDDVDETTKVAIVY